MKKILKVTAALALALCCFASCAKSQENPNQMKSFTGEVLALEETNLILKASEFGARYQFSIDLTSIDESRGTLNAGAKATLYYTGTFDPQTALDNKQEADSADSPETVDAKVRTVVVMQGEPLAQDVLAAPAVKLALNFNLPANNVKAYNTASKQDEGANSQTVWRNDTAYFPITVFTGREALKDVSVSVSDLTGPNGRIPGSGAETAFVRETAAYLGNNTRAPEGEVLKQKVPDILDSSSPAEIPAASLKNVWVSIPVPAETPAGAYIGAINVASPSLAQPLQVVVSLDVLPLDCPEPEDYTFDMELWQYPYRIAQYYDVAPFSESHFEILKKHLANYKAIGGHAITTSVVNEPWNGQTYGEYPSMIQWTKTKNGTFTFDFTDFDAWVTFCREMGLGDKIICYSMIPWENKITYYDQRSGETKSIDPKPGSSKYKKVWTQFLNALVEHTEQKGWFDSIYIGIDERPDMEKAFDVVEAVKGSNGNSFKISAAMNHFSSDYFPVIDRIHSVSVGSEAVKEATGDYRRLVEHRAANAAFETTVYTCTGHYPNSFSYSMPLESYWEMLYSGSMGATGFLRWALDAWVENPLEDSSYINFESGDCFLLYPDETDAENPQTKPSIRFKMLEKGVRDINKLYWLANQGEDWNAKAEALLATIKPTYSSLGEGVADGKAREELPADMNTFTQAMNRLFIAYAETTGLAPGGAGDV